MPRKNKGYFSLLIMAFFPCLLCSCGQDTPDISVVYTEPIVAGPFVEGSIAGTLEHVTYYDKHDIWDFRSLYIQLVFSDKKAELSMYDSFVSYDCDPLKPSSGVNSVRIFNCKYQDFKGNFHDIGERTFSISIQDYPYADSVSEKMAIILPAVFVMISIVLIVFLSLKKENVNEK